MLCSILVQRWMVEYFTNDLILPQRVCVGIAVSGKFICCVCSGTSAYSRLSPSCASGIW